MKNDVTKNLSETAILNLKAATQIGILKTLVQILNLLGMGLLFIILLLGIGFSSIHLNWISMITTIILGLIFLFVSVRCDITAARCLSNIERLLEKYE